MKAETKEFGITISGATLQRDKGSHLFSLIIDEGEDGDCQEIAMYPKELLDLHRILSVAIRLPDFMPNKIKRLKAQRLSN